MESMALRAAGGAAALLGRGLPPSRCPLHYDLIVSYSREYALRFCVDTPCYFRWRSRPTASFERSWSELRVLRNTSRLGLTVIIYWAGRRGSAAASYAAAEAQHQSYVPMADATPICYMCGIAMGSRHPFTGRLATHPSNTTVRYRCK